MSKITKELWTKEEILEEFLSASLIRLFNMCQHLEAGTLEDAQESLHTLENESWFLWKMQNRVRDHAPGALLKMQLWVEEENS